MYRIKKYSKEQAKKLGVEIKPSTATNKKIDVFKDGVKVATIGDIRYKDFPTYLEENKELAEQRRRLYKIRHKKDLNNVNSNGWYADKILW
jgi:hypothetical protein